MSFFPFEQMGFDVVQWKNYGVLRFKKRKKKELEETEEKKKIEKVNGKHVESLKLLATLILSMVH